MNFGSAYPNGIRAQDCGGHVVVWRWIRIGPIGFRLYNCLPESRG